MDPQHAPTGQDHFAAAHVIRAGRAGGSAPGAGAKGGGRLPHMAFATNKQSVLRPRYQEGSVGWKLSQTSLEDTSYLRRAIPRRPRGLSDP